MLKEAVLTTWNSECMCNGVSFVWLVGFLKTWEGFRTLATMTAIPHGIVINYTATTKCATTECGITHVCNWSSHRWLEGSEHPLVGNYQNSSLHFKQLGTHHLNKSGQSLQFNMRLQIKTAGMKNLCCLCAVFLLNRQSQKYLWTTDQWLSVKKHTVEDMHVKFGRNT